MKKLLKKTSATKPHNYKDKRDDRQYSVGVQRGKARRRVRYIAGNNPNKGCCFL